MPDSVQKLAIPPPEGHPRRTAVLALGLAATLLGAVLAVNVAIDPRGDFGTGLYRPIVDDVPREKLTLYRAAAPVEGILLGSSRAMPLPPSALAAQPSFNFGILGGSLLDDRLAYDTVVRTQGAPRLLVIALDTFQLMDLPDGRPWSEVTSSRAAADYGAGSSASHLAGAARDALSAGYLADSLHVLDLTHRTGYPVAANTFTPDGQGLRPLVDPLVANGTYDLRAAFERNWERYLGTIYTTGSVSPHQAGLLQDLVRTALSAGVEVQVVLPPFYHAALERLRPNPVFGSLLDAARDTLRGLCAPGLAVFDYTETEAFGGDAEGFYDGYHVTPANGAAMLVAMQQGRGDLCS
ncbi:MAG TPA: hypothetical protein VM286_06940 [Candidatus Thermoplasmatota archaeon]|nr:hypothetical protein [Candidatus Thermoplasmatota archaeon]